MNQRIEKAILIVDGELHEVERITMKFQLPESMLPLPLIKEKTMLEENKSPDAEWILDCQGKQDFDCSILSLCCRYYPSRDYTSAGGAITKPSAIASIIIPFRNEVGLKDFTTIVECDIEGKNEQEVKRMVEEWASAEYRKIISNIGLLYGAPESIEP